MLLCYSPNTSEMNNLNLVNITPNISVHYAGGDWELTQHHCYMYCTVLYCTCTCTCTCNSYTVCQSMYVMYCTCVLYLYSTCTWLTSPLYLCTVLYLHCTVPEPVLYSAGHDWLQPVHLSNTDQVLLQLIAIIESATKDWTSFQAKHFVL